MSILDNKDPLRPMKGLGGWLTTQAFALAPTIFAILRRIKPILRLGSTVIVSRYDDVREVFNNDAVFDTPYKAHIEVLTSGEPFFLGMRDTPEYRRDLAAMRRVFTDADLPMLGERAEAMAQAIIDQADGRIEVVGELVRKVTFDLYADYIGIPQPPTGNLDVWSTRLFEFQFLGTPKDTELRAEVDVIAPALRAHIDATIAQRKASRKKKDDVLGRCLALQAGGDALYSDVFIRTSLLCMMVGGPPQVPMVTPQALEQLLRRPRALADAQTAARAGDDALLWKITREAMRFDPLAPGVQRVAVTDGVIAPGLARQTRIKPGMHVLVGFASAMMDPRRLRDPNIFNARRQDHEYIHFGHGLHECFGLFMNRATLHRILKPLLVQNNLRRAPGSAGHLRKRGLFADRLHVTYSGLHPVSKADSSAET